MNHNKVDHYRAKNTLNNPTKNQRLDEKKGLLDCLRIKFPNYNFKNFIVDESNKEAVKASKNIYKESGGKVPLVFYSDTGLGKAHLAHAVYNEFKKKHPKSSICRISSEAFYSHFQSSYSRDAVEVERFISKHLHLKCLVVFSIQFFETNNDIRDSNLSYKHTKQDDTKTNSSTPSAKKQHIASKGFVRGVFYQLISRLIKQNCKIVLTCDRHPKNLHGYPYNILYKSGYYPIGFPSLNGRIEIVEQQFKNKEIVLNKLIILMIANSCKHNSRLLIGACNKIITTSLLFNREISVELTKSCILHL